MTDRHEWQSGKPAPRWSTAWPEWFGIFDNVTVMPAIEHEALLEAIESELPSGMAELVLERAEANFSKSLGFNYDAVVEGSKKQGKESEMTDELRHPAPLSEATISYRMDWIRQCLVAYGGPLYLDTAAEIDEIERLALRSNKDSPSRLVASHLRDFADFLPVEKREDFNATIDDLMDRLATAHEANTALDRAIRSDRDAPLDRSDAVNLARNVCDSDAAVTPTGIKCLADAVLRMDAALRADTGYVRGLEEAYLAYEAHTHSNDPRSYDDCLSCGENFRHPIHLRMGETRESRIRALKSAHAAQIAAPQASPSVAPTDSEFGSAVGPVGAAPCVVVPRGLLDELMQIFRWCPSVDAGVVGPGNLLRDILDAALAAQSAAQIATPQVQELGSASSPIAQEPAESATPNNAEQQYGGGRAPGSSATCVVVPREPTQAMIDAALKPMRLPAYGEHPYTQAPQLVAAMYRAMLAVAPAAQPNAELVAKLEQIAAGIKGHDVSRVCYEAARTLSHER